MLITILANIHVAFLTFCMVLTFAVNNVSRKEFLSACLCVFKYESEQVTETQM